MTVISLADYQPSERYDSVAWTSARIEGANTSSGPWATVETITLSPVESDPANPRTRNFTTAEADSTQVWFRVVFIDDDGNEEFTDATPVGFRGFATVADIEIRAGRELNDTEQALADMVIKATTGLIISSANRDLEWAMGLAPVPEIFRWLCVVKAWGMIGNPFNLSMSSETLGAHTVTSTYQRGSAGGIGVYLDSDEERAVSEAVRSMYEIEEGEAKSILTEIDEQRLSFQPPWVTSRYPAENNN